MSNIIVAFYSEDGSPIPVKNNAIVNWENFKITDSYLHASSSFSMKVGDDKVTDDVRQLLSSGCTRVQISVDIGDGNARIIITGRIDEATFGGSADGQITWELAGRSLLGPAIDYEVDPWSNLYQIVDGTTVAKIISNIFTNFGFTTITDSNIANRLVKTGNDIYNSTVTTKTVTYTEPSIIEENGVAIASASGSTVSKTTSTTYDSTNNYALEAMTLKQSKPENNEKAYSFGERIVKRFGEHITCSANGQSIIVSSPDYNQQPIYAFTFSFTDPNKTNIKKHHKKIQFKEQPSLIIGRGQTEAGDLNSTTIRSAKASEFYGYDSSFALTPPVQSCLNQYKNLKPIPFNSNLSTYQQYFQTPKSTQTLYIYDHHATSVAEIGNTITRKMSEHMRKALTLTYTVQDFFQEYNGKNSVYSTDTVASVNDELFNISGNFWIETVEFSLDENGGTETTLTMIPLWVLIISPK